MNILVLNAGSSSIKFQLFKNLKVILKGQIDAINKENCELWIEIEKVKITKPIKAKNHKEAIKIGLNSLIVYKAIKNFNEINVVGHRIVHGGEEFKKATILNKNIIKKIEKYSYLAPLHNPNNLAGVYACQKLLPKVKQVAVFDTSFHQTMPEKAFKYSLPEEFYSKDRIRRYGFHGISHKFVSNIAYKKLKSKKRKIITCHLGNGSSITAIKNGISIDTSMGLTPMAGIPMGTRCGDIDPDIPIFISKTRNKKPKEVEEILNKKSGFIGLTGTSDMRIIYQNSLKNDKKAKFMIELLSYKIAQYIGSYTTIMQGLDALVFTAGLGENAFYIRKEVCNYLNWMGLKLDDKKNKNNEEEISKNNSKIKVFVIKTNEELEIAKEIKKII
jgi:acetate kinase